jgi:hypothetical protein
LGGNHGRPTQGSITRDSGDRRMFAIAGTGYGLIGILVIVLLVVLILYFVKRV